MEIAIALAFFGIFALVMFVPPPRFSPKYVYDSEGNPVSTTEPGHMNVDGDFTPDELEAAQSAGGPISVPTPSL